MASPVIAEPRKVDLRLKLRCANGGFTLGSAGTRGAHFDRGGEQVGDTVQPAAKVNLVLFVILLRREMFDVSGAHPLLTQKGLKLLKGYDAGHRTSILHAPSREQPACGCGQPEANGMQSRRGILQQ